MVYGHLNCYFLCCFFQWNLINEKSTFEIWFLLYSNFLKHGHLSWGNSVVSKFTGILFILSALNTPLDNSDSSLFDVGKKGFFIVRDDIQTLSIGIRKVCMHLETK